MIKSGCPRWICNKCGKARVRIVEVKYVNNPKGGYIKGGRFDNSQDRYESKLKESYTIGWTDCGCNAGWRAGVVLDPFVGSGTTMLVAMKLSRNSIGIELNPDYVEIAKKRLMGAGAKLKKETDNEVIFSYPTQLVLGDEL
ncbi:MAG TPA: site-specific DNA-methyltransferase [Thermoplasmatales archaeon]|nr:site-specific DNA-methyltransferase [Thermoplasmatales archaeon]